jgi:hypothetical protein
MQTDPTDHPSPDPGDSPEGERFAHGLRQTWELEMLISGAVVFALLQLPSAVDQGYERLDPHLEGSLAYGLFIVLYYAKLALYALIASFLVHLASRAYWVGLIGLEAVFPRGVQWEKVTSGPIGRRLFEKRLLSLPALIARTDDFCSMIFSFSFLIVFVFVLSVFLAGLLGLLAFGISRLFLGGEHLGVVFRVLMLLLLVPYLVVTMLDKVVGPKLDPASRPARVLHAANAFYYRAFFMDLYGPIMLTLFSNIRKQVMYPLFTAAFLGLVGLFFLGEMRRGGRLSLDSDIYMPVVAGEREVSPSYYENLRPEDEVFRMEPSIQSDVVTDPYLRLFIPYYPRRDNPALARRCPGLKPLREPGLTLKDRNASPPPAAAAAEVLRCLSDLHRVSLDGKPLAGLELNFSTHPKTGVRGLVGYVPVADLPRGSHLLRVEAVPRPEPRKGDRPPDPYLIRFWL